MSNPPKNHRSQRACLFALALGFSAPGVIPSLQAASDTWNNATANSWQSPLNWLSGTQFPGANSGFTSPDDATFGTIGAAGAIGLDGTINVRSLIFGVAGADAAAFTIGGAADVLNLSSGGGITINAGVTTNQIVGATIHLSNVLTATDTFANNGTGTLTITGGLVQNAPTGSSATVNSSLLTVTGSGNTTIAGAITNAGAAASTTVGTSLLKTGTGTLTLGNDSVWAGNAAQATAAVTAQFPLVVRAGTLLLNGGTHTVTGEAVVGGFTVAGSAGNNARLQIDAGTLAVSGYLSVGRGNGTGAVSSDLVANNAAVITAANFSAGFNGASTLNLVRGSITLNNEASFTITGNGAFTLGESAGSNMTMTLNNAATVTAAGTAIKYIGQLGTGTLTLNGTSAVSFGDATAITYVGFQSGVGFLNINGGTFTNGGEVRVGGSATNGAFGGSGTITMTGGTATVGALTLARGNNNTATMSGSATISGGTFTSINDVVLGFAGAGNLGKLTISGGTVNVGTATTKWLQVGVWDTSRGQLDITSGALNLNTSSSIKFNVQTGIGANVINQSGGAVTFYSDNATTIGGGGVLDMQTLGAAASSNTYNLNGGTLTVPQIVSTGTTGTRIFNFNGGTLRAATTTTAFLNLGLTGTHRANVRNGGAIIDTNGFDVTVAEALVHSNVGGDNITDGGLSKMGAGVLTLSGANTYTGATVVSAGTLRLDATGSLQGSLSLTVANGATLQLDQRLSLNDNIVLVLAGGSSLFLNFDAAFGSETVQSLSLGGTPFLPGTYQVGDLTGFGVTVTGNGSLTVTAVPEPSVVALFGLGIAGLLLRRRSRASRS